MHILFITQLLLLFFYGNITFLVLGRLQIFLNYILNTKTSEKTNKQKKKEQHEQDKQETKQKKKIHF